MVVQRGGTTAVYKSNGEYLRIGESVRIERDLKRHKKMEENGLPVAPLITDGELNGQRYFIERSLGEKRLRDLFEEDTARYGTISESNFESFLRITELFGRAQIKTVVPSKDFDEFAKGIYLDTLCAELADHKGTIRRRFENAAEKLKSFPFVITHGDLSPSNMYPDGVIDLEDSFHGPFGYDLVSSLVTNDYVPESPEYEFHAKYRFSENQRKNYLNLLDRILSENNLPPISDFIADFEFCRAVWLAVGMSKWPKVQKFRYDLLIKKFL